MRARFLFVQISCSPIVQVSTSRHTRTRASSKEALPVLLPLVTTGQHPLRFFEQTRTLTMRDPWLNAK